MKTARRGARQSPRTATGARRRRASKSGAPQHVERLQAPAWMEGLKGADQVRIEKREPTPRSGPLQEWTTRITLPADLSTLTDRMDPLIPAFTVADAIRDLEAKLVELVCLCRAQGHTWTKIGEAIGVSKQAAWERFSGEE